MAIYHCSASVIGRKAGRSICAAAAYRAGEAITDERTGQTHNFTRKGGVLHSEIIAPAGAPDWAIDRARLWNEAERAEDKSTRRATATTAREFRLALPHELDEGDRLLCVREFGRYMADTYGVAVDFSIHAPDGDGDSRNHHAHILISDRRLTDAGFAGKVRELSARNGGEKTMKAIRAQWATIANRHLAAAGLDVSIDHRSYKAQWIDREATTHMGPAATAMERRGEASDIGDRNREIKADNAARETLKAEYEALGKALLREETARAERADERAEQHAIRAHDPAAILATITEKHSTFTKAELEATLRKTVHSDGDRRNLLNAVFAHSELVALSEQPGGKATRYTTESVLKHEAAGLEAARDLMADKSHSVSRATIRRIVESGKYGSMSEEQHRAFIRATGGDGLAIIAGEAGTGKSYVANAIREAYEAEGYRVIGLAVTNKVIQDMGRDGFQHTRTIHGALQDVAKDRAGWNRKTVLIVDEAAMLSTKQTVDIKAAAARAGAKVIPIQDTAQLGSAFARGGLAGAIEAEHPAAVSRLSEIRRIKDTAHDAAGQKQAFNLMHDGRWKEALSILDKGGAIQWSATTDEARAALVTQYAQDVEARPDRRRFTLAQSNADVLRLNADLRAVHRARGDLGADHVLQTKDGPQPFAVGDRVQFTATAYKVKDREAGLANGNHGTIQKIDKGRVTVTLDGPKDQKPRVVSFTVGENARAGEFNGLRHGYAGTIYRTQGSTVDEVSRLHTGAERSSSNYVGNTRHTETLRVFTSREAVRGADPWMRERGGLDTLTEAKRESAERSYAKWAEANPELGRRHGLADYVAYVQDQWAKDQSRAVDIEALARQMGRREENRAASQFHRVEREAPPPTAERPDAQQPQTPAATVRPAATVTTARAPVQPPKTDTKPAAPQKATQQQPKAKERPQQPAKTAAPIQRPALPPQQPKPEPKTPPTMRHAATATTTPAKAPAALPVMQQPKTPPAPIQPPPVETVRPAAQQTTARAPVQPVEPPKAAPEAIPAPPKQEATQQAATAQKTAARIGAMSDPVKQANALQKAHHRDAAKIETTKPAALPDYLDAYRAKLAGRVDEMKKAEATRDMTAAALAKAPSFADRVAARTAEAAATRTQEAGNRAERTLATYEGLRRRNPSTAQKYLSRAYEAERRAEMIRSRGRGGLAR